MSKDTNPCKSYLVFSLEDENPWGWKTCIHSAGFWVKLLGPSVQFLQKIWHLQASLQGPYSKHGLSGAPPRLPGSEYPGGALEPEFLTNLPSGSQTNSNRGATGVYILDKQHSKSGSGAHSQARGQTGQESSPGPPSLGPQLPF